MKKGGVGMAKCFSKKYRNKGRAFNYLQSESYVKMPVRGKVIGSGVHIYMHVCIYVCGRKKS